MAWYGPIVMNTQEQLRQAFEELEKGTFLKGREATVMAAKYLILGGGMVAGYAAKEMVELGLSGRAGDRFGRSRGPLRTPASVQRIPGSRTPRRASASIPEEFYRDHGIEAGLGCAIAGVDAERKRLHPGVGRRIRL